MSDDIRELEALRVQNAALIALATARPGPSTSVAEALEPIAVTARDVLGASRVEVWLLSEDESLLRRVACVGGAGVERADRVARQVVELGDYVDVLRRERCLQVADPEADQRLVVLGGDRDDEGSGPTLELALCIGDHLRGVLRLERRPDADGWDRTDERFAVSMAHMASAAVASHEREEQSSVVEALLESASQAILIAGSDGCIRMANRMAATVFGYAADELVGMSAEALVPPERRASVRADRDRFFADPTTSPLAEGRIVIGLRRDGTTFPARVALSVIRHRDKIHALAMVTDETERQERDQALREREAMYRAVVDDLDEYLIRGEVGGQLTFANRKAREAFGVDEDEIEARNIYEYVPEEDHQILRDGASQLSPTTPTVRYEHRITEPSGELASLEVILRGLFDDAGRLTGYQSIGRDVSQAKRQEARLREAQRMETLAIFSAGIAHDFNNLLTPIVGYTDLLRGEVDDQSPLAVYLDEIAVCADRAAELVGHILAFNRPREDAERSLVRAAPLIAETMQVVRASLPATQMVNVAMDSDCGHIRANPSDVYQILSNLCTNAHQAMPAGGALDVSASVLRPSGSDAGRMQLQLIVSDSGHGIPREIVDRVFEPFFTTKPTGEGTGLGLSVVRETVESLGGRVEIQSEPGRGTSIVVLLPIEEAPAAGPAASTSSVLTGSESVLVVDDEAAIVSLLRSGLEPLGYRVTARTSANEALAAFSADADAFDAAVLDLTMPHMSGAELARRLRSVRPNLAILLVTGFGELLDPQEIDALPVDRVLDKPVRPRDVATALRGVIERRRS